MQFPGDLGKSTDPVAGVGDLLGRLAGAVHVGFGLSADDLHKGQMSRRGLLDPLERIQRGGYLAVRCSLIRTALAPGRPGKRGHMPWASAWRLGERLPACCS